MERLFGCDCARADAAGGHVGAAPQDARPRLPSPLRAFLGAITGLAVLAWAVPDGGVAEAIGLWAWLGLLPLSTGLGLMLRADAQFKSAGTTVKPFRAAARLVTDGAFHWSRHPMYLGMLLMLAGLAVIMGSPAALLACIPFAAYMERTFMLPEEWRLESQFRREYREYRQRVRRWVSLPLG